MRRAVWKGTDATSIYLGVQHVAELGHFHGATPPSEVAGLRQHMVGLRVTCEDSNLDLLLHPDQQIRKLQHTQVKTKSANQSIPTQAEQRASMLAKMQTSSGLMEVGSSRDASCAYHAALLVSLTTSHQSNRSAIWLIEKRFEMR